jgi:hypothetical protein
VRKRDKRLEKRENQIEKKIENEIGRKLRASNSQSKQGDRAVRVKSQAKENGKGNYIYNEEIRKVLKTRDKMRKDTKPVSESSLAHARMLCLFDLPHKW